MEIVVFVVVVVASIFGVKHAEQRQIRGMETRCSCTCAPVYGEWPWVQRDIVGLLKPKETVKKYPWFTGGVIVCARPDEADPKDRIAALQQAIDEATVRGIEEGRSLFK